MYKDTRPLWKCVLSISVYLIVLKVSEQGPEEGSSMLFVGSDEGVHMAKQTLGAGSTVCVTSDHTLVKGGKRQHTGYIYYTIPWRDIRVPTANVQDLCNVYTTT